MLGNGFANGQLHDSIELGHTKLLSGKSGSMALLQSAAISHFPLPFVQQVLVFTHCGLGLGPTSVPQLIEDLKAKALLNANSKPNHTTSSPQKTIAIDAASNCDWIPFSDASKLSFICLGHTNDTYFQQALKVYQKLLDVSGQHGQLFIATGDSSETTKSKSSKNVHGSDANGQLPTIVQWKSDIVPKLIDRVCESNYKRFEAVLKCGGYHKLEAAIIIWPSPKVSKTDDEAETLD